MSNARTAILASYVPLNGCITMRSSDRRSAEHRSYDTNESSFRFHDLPAELRNLLYNELLPKDSDYFKVFGERRDTVPAIMKASRQIRSETLPIWYSRNRFHCNAHSSGEHVTDVLKTIGENGLKHIRRLRLSDIARCSQSHQMFFGPQEVVLVRLDVDVVRGEHQQTTTGSRSCCLSEGLRQLTAWVTLIGQIADKTMHEVRRSPWIDRETSGAFTLTSASQSAGIVRFNADRPRSTAQSRRPTSSTTPHPTIVLRASEAYDHHPRQTYKNRIIRSVGLTGKPVMFDRKLCAVLDGMEGDN